MKVDTFYIIMSEDGNYRSIYYPAKDYNSARDHAIDMARTNLGKKYHILKRVTSVKSQDLTWEDSGF